MPDVPLVAPHHVLPRVMAQRVSGEAEADARWILMFTYTYDYIVVWLGIETHTQTQKKYLHRPSCNHTHTHTPTPLPKKTNKKKVRGPRRRPEGPALERHRRRVRGDRGAGRPRGGFLHHPDEFADPGMYIHTPDH